MAYLLRARTFIANNRNFWLSYIYAVHQTFFQRKKH